MEFTCRLNIEANIYWRTYLIHENSLPKNYDLAAWREDAWDSFVAAAILPVPIKEWSSAMSHSTENFEEHCEDLRGQALAFYFRFLWRFIGAVVTKSSNCYSFFFQCLVDLTKFQEKVFVKIHWCWKQQTVATGVFGSLMDLTKFLWRFIGAEGDISLSIVLQWTLFVLLPLLIVVTKLIQTQGWRKLSIYHQVVLQNITIPQILPNPIQSKWILQVKHTYEQRAVWPPQMRETYRLMESR